MSDRVIQEYPDFVLSQLLDGQYRIRRRQSGIEVLKFASRNELTAIQAAGIFLLAIENGAKNKRPE
ncbi:hypothetical protein ACWJKU_12230 [Methylocaldum sp. MU1018]